MASYAIETKQQLRPCYVKGEKALFHRWADLADAVPASIMVGGPPGGQYWDVFGIVEAADGSVSRVPFDEICFVDTKEIMCGIPWPEAEEDPLEALMGRLG